MNAGHLKEFLKDIPDETEIDIQIINTKHCGGVKRVMYGQYNNEEPVLIFAPYGTHLFEGEEGYKEISCLQCNGRIDK